MIARSKLLVVALTVLACVACGAAVGMAAPKGTLSVGVEAETYSMDPLVAWMTYGMVMMRQIYDTPIDFNPDGTLKPRLATKWEQTDDLTWRFHMRKGVKFHNGYPFTAHDVKFTLERILDPANKCRYRSRYSTVDKIIVVDDYTLDVKTKTPDAVLPRRMAFFVRVISKKWVEENGIEKLRKQAMGTGPFKFVSWQRKDKLVLEANTDHYQTVPKVKTLIFRPIPEMGARMAELQSGGVQIVTNVPPFMMKQLEKKPDLALQKVLSLRSMFMVLNTLKVDALKKQKVRLALNYAVDKEAIINGICSGLGKPEGLSAAPQVQGVDKKIKPYPYDPAKAKALLKEAGYPDGFQLNLFSPSGRYPMDKEVVQAVAEQLSKVGIKTKVHVMETQKYFKKFIAKELDGAFLIGHALMLWDQGLLVSFVNPKASYCHYHNAQIEKLIHKMRSIMDQKKRYEVAHKIQWMIHDEAPMIFLYNLENVYGVSKKVDGFKARADDHMDLWKVTLKK